MKNSIKLLLTGVVSALCAGILRAQDSWQSQLLKVAGDGALTYIQNADGFVLPDFSQAGYRNGERTGRKRSVRCRMLLRIIRRTFRLPSIR